MDTSREQDLAQQLETLRSEKAALEKALEDERAAHSGDATPVAALQATIVRTPLMMLSYPVVNHGAGIVNGGTRQATRGEVFVGDVRHLSRFVTASPSMGSGEERAGEGS